MAIGAIQRMKSMGVFSNYINKITFPFFKSIEEGNYIEFNFPLTVLVGKNGSGKSSVLKALYGAPKGMNCGHYWFSTNLDPIIESGVDGKRNCFFYSYSESMQNQDLEVLYQRAPRKNEPDYWETADPVLKYGMKKVPRNAPVVKNVVYIDFRAIISAFDRFFYFGTPKEGKKQDFLRKKSSGVLNLYNNLKHGLPGRYVGDISKKVVELTDDELSCVNHILGKEYSKVKILEHRLYGAWGSSIFVKNSKELNYSEANAGSGEIAMILLVHQILNAPAHSLILLDEPEVSLHPGAQKRLKIFLLKQIIKKKHQIIISTHSPVLIEKLPDCAIKLFSSNRYGKFRIDNNVSYSEAFFDIAEIVPDKKIILCEDISAQILITKVLNFIGKKEFINVVAAGGAESIIQKYVPVLSESSLNHDAFLLLDGDKYSSSVDSQQFTQSQQQDIHFLKEQVAQCYSGVRITLYADGNQHGGNIAQLCEKCVQYINFHSTNVFYLPNKRIPEQIILNSKYVQDDYNHILEEYSDPLTACDAKNVVRTISITRGDEKNSVTVAALTTEWLKENSEELEELTTILNKIFQSEVLPNTE